MNIFQALGLKQRPVILIHLLCIGTIAITQIIELIVMSDSYPHFLHLIELITELNLLDPVVARVLF
jgi:hypothetical protein